MKRIALVGCSGMGSFYRHLYQHIDGAELALLVDINEDVAKSASEALGGVRWSTRFEDALSPDIDIVDLNTPNFLHKPQALAAIAAGKHVLVQKPLAPSVAEAQAIADAAKTSAGTVGLYMNMRDNPAYQDLKRIVEQGLLGQISSVSCRMAHPGGLTAPSGGWRNDLSKTGGGSFIQLTLHHINALQWLLGEKITSVMAYSKRLLSPNIAGDDLTNAACEFESGIQGSLESSYCAHGDSISLYGTKGYVTLVRPNTFFIMQLAAPFEGNFVRYTGNGEEIQNCNFKPMTVFTPDNPFEQHMAFVRAIIAGKPAPVSLEEGVYDLRVVEAVYRSAKSGQREDV